MLLTSSGLVKLADFGISTYSPDGCMRHHTAVGTPYWMAPEVIQESCYNSLVSLVFQVSYSGGYLVVGHYRHRTSGGTTTSLQHPSLEGGDAHHHTSISRTRQRWQVVSRFRRLRSLLSCEGPKESSERSRTTSSRESESHCHQHPFVATTVKKLQFSHGRSNTMKHMIARLNEMKKQVGSELGP